MGKIVQAIGAGVGLIAEATSSRRSKSPAPIENGVNGYEEDSKEKQKLKDDESDSSDSSDSEADDEADWALDEASAKAQPEKKYDFKAQPTIDSLVQIILSKSAPPPYMQPQLACPVILPQRRPGTNNRGFVRAYAPMLNDFGIDQATFLSFIETFDIATQASPILGIIYLSAGIIGFVPHGWAMITSTVLQVAAGAAIEQQRRSRGNSFMDQVNEKLFKPRGLFAMVMTYIPNAPRPIDVQATDINSIIAGQKSGFSILGPKVQKGETYGELELPESAPLIFPGLDQETQTKIETANKWERTKKFMSDYQDRRAQARYMNQNPESRLNLPADQQPKFNSSLGDPSHPAYQGSWLTLLSGGKIPPSEKSRMSKDDRRAARWERRQAKREYKNARREMRGRSPRPPRRRDLEGPGGKRARRAKKRMAKSNILYLMIVPLPSESEMKTSQREWNEAAAAQGQEGILKGE